MKIPEKTKKKISDTLKRKGICPPLFTQKHSQKTKDKLREKMKGRKITWGDKISEKLKGRKCPWSAKSLPHHKGENHYNWKGGISITNKYPIEFNKELKLKIRTRDNFTCCLCGRTEREELEELNRVLCVNHIDFDKNNCKENNLNTLCLRCNVKINRERDYWTNFFNN